MRASLPLPLPAPVARAAKKNVIFSRFVSTDPWPPEPSLSSRGARATLASPSGAVRVSVPCRGRGGEGGGASARVLWERLERSCVEFAGGRRGA